MNLLALIEEAIKSRIPIQFSYIRPEKTPGTRIGNPHAAFIERVSSGEERTYLHLWQTGGDSDSRRPLPSWRKFFLNDLTEIKLLTDKTPFQIAVDYNPSSYKFPIAKI